MPPHRWSPKVIDVCVEGLEKICPNCSKTFWICKRCWRGQKYCGDPCRADVRKRNHRLIERRYASTPKGKESRRRRQRKFRKIRLALRTVTDHTSNQCRKNIKDNPQAFMNAKNECSCCKNKVSPLSLERKDMKNLNIYFSFSRWNRSL